MDEFQIKTLQKLDAILAAFQSFADTINKAVDNGSRTLYEDITEERAVVEREELNVKMEKLALEKLEIEKRRNELLGG